MADYLEITEDENAPYRNPHAVAKAVLKVQVTVLKDIFKKT